MNSLKSLTIFALLAATSYGVYYYLNMKPNPPPPGAPDSIGNADQLVDEGAPADDANWGSATGQSATSAGQLFPAIPAAAQTAQNGPFTIPPSNALPPDQAGTGFPPSGNQSAAGGPSSDPRYDNVAAGRADAATATTQPGQADYAANAASFGQNAAARGGADPANSGANLIETMRRMLDEGRLAEAHQQLSRCYENPQLTGAEQQQVNELLDQVAGTVVYSTQHLLEPPYEVQPGERLEDIGQKYNVPWQLLAKINGVDDPHGLRPGERLKVVRGPFSAVVNLDRRELTLLVGGAYAGRFAIGIGRDYPVQEGTYVVTEKVANPVYHGGDRAIDPGDRNNPLGNRWLGLGTGQSASPGATTGIHGTNDPNNIGRTDLFGGISLAPRDIEDVFDILSVGSPVVLRHDADWTAMRSPANYGSTTAR